MNATNSSAEQSPVFRLMLPKEFINVPMTEEYSADLRRLYHESACARNSTCRCSQVELTTCADSYYGCYLQSSRTQSVSSFAMSVDDREALRLLRDENFYELLVSYLNLRRDENDENVNENDVLLCLVSKDQISRSGSGKWLLDKTLCCSFNAKMRYLLNNIFSVASDSSPAVISFTLPLKRNKHLRFHPQFDIDRAKNRDDDLFPNESDAKEYAQKWKAFLRRATNKRRANARSVLRVTLCRSPSLNGGLHVQCVGVCVSIKTLRALEDAAKEEFAEENAARGLVVDSPSSHFVPYAHKLGKAIHVYREATDADDAVSFPVCNDECGCEYVRRIKPRLSSVRETVNRSAADDGHGNISRSGRIRGDRLKSPLDAGRDSDGDQGGRRRRSKRTRTQYERDAAPTSVRQTKRSSPRRSPRSSARSTSMDARENRGSQLAEKEETESVSPRKRRALSSSALESSVPEPCALESSVLQSTGLQASALQSSSLRSVALDSVALDSVALDSVALDSVALDSVALESVAIDSSALDSVALDSVAHESSVPETSAPETGASDVTTSNDPRQLADQCQPQEAHAATAATTAVKAGAVRVATAGPVTRRRTPQSTRERQQYRSQEIAGDGEQRRQLTLAAQIASETHSDRQNCRNLAAETPSRGTEVVEEHTRRESYDASDFAVVEHLRRVTHARIPSNSDDETSPNIVITESRKCAHRIARQVTIDDETPAEKRSRRTQSEATASTRPALSSTPTVATTVVPAHRDLSNEATRCHDDIEFTPGTGSRPYSMPNTIATSPAPRVTTVEPAEDCLLESILAEFFQGNQAVYFVWHVVEDFFLKNMEASLGKSERYTYRYNFKHLAFTLAALAVTVFRQSAARETEFENSNETQTPKLYRFSRHLTNAILRDRVTLKAYVLKRMDKCVDAFRQISTPRSPTVIEVFYSLLHLALWCGVPSKKRGITSTGGEIYSTSSLGACVFQIASDATNPKILTDATNEDDDSSTQRSWTTATATTTTATTTTASQSGEEWRERFSNEDMLEFSVRNSAIDREQFKNFLISLMHPFDGNVFWTSTLSESFWKPIDKEHYRYAILGPAKRTFRVSKKHARGRPSDGETCFAVQHCWTTATSVRPFPAGFIVCSGNEIFSTKTRKQIANVPLIRTQPFFASGICRQVFLRMSKHPEEIINFLRDLFRLQRELHASHGTECYITYPNAEIASEERSRVDDKSEREQKRRLVVRKKASLSSAAESGAGSPAQSREENYGGGIPGDAGEKNRERRSQQSDDAGETRASAFAKPVIRDSDRDQLVAREIDAFVREQCAISIRTSVRNLIDQYVARGIRANVLRGCVALLELFADPKRLGYVAFLISSILFENFRKVVIIGFSPESNHGKSNFARVLYNLFSASAAPLSFASLSTLNENDPKNPSLVEAAGKTIAIVDEIAAAPTSISYTGTNDDFEETTMTTSSSTTTTAKLKTPKKASLACTLSSALIKTLTGDTQSCGYRKLNENSSPCHFNAALFLFANSFPTFSNVSQAERDRLRFVRFPRHFSSWSSSHRNVDMSQKNADMSDALAHIVTAVEYATESAAATFELPKLVNRKTAASASDCVGEPSSILPAHFSPDYEEGMNYYNSAKNIVSLFRRTYADMFKRGTDFYIAKQCFAQFYSISPLSSFVPMSDALEEFTREYEKSVGCSFNKDIQ